MATSPWQLREADAAQVASLSRTLDLPAAVVRVMINRGVAEASSAQRYLDPRLAHLCPPSGMADLGAAVERLSDAVCSGEKIGVFGDYDVDGVSSAALVGDYLARCDADVVLRVSRRDEGYGFSPIQAQEMVGRGCRVLVLTDCGTSDAEAVAAAASAGVDVIAFDHHRVADVAWPGLALINPHRNDCGFPYKGLCSAGVAFYAMAALRRHLEARKARVADPRDNLDLVALATLSDVAPLDGENRILVKKGLETLARTGRPGLRELLRLAELADRVPTAGDVQWRLGPRLNAPGRLGDAVVALECLWLRDADRAVARARECDRINEERKRIQQQVLDRAVAQANPQADRGFVLVAGEGWHPGVVGIVAARLTETFGCPAAVVAIEGPSGRGSARSVEGIDLFSLLTRCAPLMERYGGHAAAAGFTVSNDKIEALREALQAEARDRVNGLESPPLLLDGVLELAGVDESLCESLAQLAPYGESNPEPVFAVAGACVEASRQVGADHLQLAVSQGGGVRSAIGFGMANRLPEIGTHVDLAFVPQIEHYRGARVRLRLVDLTAAGHGLAGGTAA